MSAEILLPEFDAWRDGYRSAGESPEQTETPETSENKSVESYMERARLLFRKADFRFVWAEYRHPTLIYNYSEHVSINTVTRQYNGLELTLSNLAPNPTARQQEQFDHHLPVNYPEDPADRFAVYAGGELVFVVDGTDRFGDPVILDHTGEKVQDDPAFNDMVDRTIQLFEADPSAISDPASS